MSTTAERPATAAGAPSFLAANDLHHVFGPGTPQEHHALGGISLSVREGEFVSVVGPSGCGKTTLLRCLSGLMTPSSGTVTLHGERVTAVPKDLTLVFQDYGRSLYPWLKVRANVDFPLRDAGLDKAERAERVGQALADVGLEAHGEKYPRQLSGGMQQRVAIARALAYRPALLLMDEPYASVDAQTRAALEDMLLSVWAARRKTVLFVTHDIDESVYLADRVIVLSKSPARVIADLDVDISRPRDQIDTKSLHRFVELRAEVARIVRAEGHLGTSTDDGGESRVSDLAITAGGAIFRRLRQLGVDVVLVNSGTDFPPIIEGLAEAETYGVDVPRSIVVPHEHVAMGIAHGYYFASGRAQAVILHTNVGLANGAIGAINAATDHVPVILMSGRTPTVERGRFGARTVPIGWGQEMRDQAALVREACKWEYEVRFPEQVPELLDRAYAIASSTPKGPVYLSLPREVLCEPCPAEALDAPISARAASIVAAPDQIAEAADVLAAAERPLIVAQRGAGSPAGFEALARIADRWSIPVCQYWANATAISAEHPMYVGQDPAPWVAEADAILVIDSLAPWVPDVHEPPAGCTVVHLGPNPLYSRVPVRHFRSDLSITSEVGDGLVALEEAMSALGLGHDSPSRTRRRALIDDRNATRLERSRADVEAGSGTPMTKAWVSRCVAEAIRDRSSTVISELGCPFEPLGPTDHGSWHQEPHSGGLGWGLPCAMGIKLADPERLVVATMGDGAYMFANPVACHHVAEAHDIALLTVVLNNAGYDAVRHAVLDLYPTGYAAKADEMPLTTLTPTPDFALVARACRAHAETVTNGADLPAALARAIHAVTDEHRQALLDVHVA